MDSDHELLKSQNNFVTAAKALLASMNDVEVVDHNFDELMSASQMYRASLHQIALEVPERMRARFIKRARDIATFMDEFGNIIEAYTSDHGQFP